MLKKLLLVSVLLLSACTSAAVESVDSGTEATQGDRSDSGDDVQAGTGQTSAEDDGPVETDEKSDAQVPALAGAGSADLDDPYVGNFGNGGYDVSHYDLDLTWDPEREQLDGVATITATATETLKQFNLDLVGLTVEQVEVDGQPARFSQDDPELIVTPASELAADGEFSIEVTYGGRPGEGQSRGPGIVPSGWQTRDGYSYVAGEPVAAATFHPANDHPSDKASFTYRITAPADLHVAANGTLKSAETDGDRKTWVFDQPFPQTTYLTTILIGSFETVDAGTSASGIPIRNVYDTELTAAASPIFEMQADMLDAFEDLFGPYPFDIYGSAVVKDSLGGALETQTLSIFGQDVVGFGRFAEIIIAHELAHQWFGNSVSVDRWEDLWLNEGFASYAEALWLDHSDPSFTYEGWVGDILANGPALEERVQAHPVSDLFGIQIYQRGALALHALRLELGDDVFFDLLQTWVERFGGGNATTADFEALAEELSGKELTPLFDEWIRAEALPPKLGELDLRASATDSFFALDDLRAAIADYALCMDDAGSVFEADPLRDEPNDLLDEITRLRQADGAANGACEDLLEAVGL